MNHDLTLTLVQFDIRWHDPQANRTRVSELLDEAGSPETDLIVLPEMFTTGFTMASADVAETMSGETVRWMQAQADTRDAVVTGTIAIRDGDGYVNRLIWAEPGGETSHYDKRHLFRMADEHTAYRAGAGQPVFERAGWRIRPIICYDLRFPVWCRNVDDQYDALLCPANWPDPRHHAWLSLLTARAIENQACVIANNRIGTDGLGKHYLGNSMVIDAKGRTVCDAGHEEAVLTMTLSRDELMQFREKFPVHADADAFELTPRAPV